MVEFLAAPSTHGDAHVERLETHTAMVFLGGNAAWKLKRAVRYDYLDFSTLERRKAMCEAEVRINRRTAPACTRGVGAVTREADGSLAIAGRGTPVEWLVQMTRFDQDGLFDRLAASGRLDGECDAAPGLAIASFHRDAERRFDHGGEAGMRWILDGNAAGFAEHGAGVLDTATCADVNSAARRVLERQRGLLDARRAAGFVRQCHGDLHLRNIVLVDGRPTLFDAIEFNKRLACIDVLYDLAFVLMDLGAAGSPGMPICSGTATSSRRPTSTGHGCSRCSCRAAQPSARRRMPLLSRCSRIRSAGANCRCSPGDISRWPAPCWILRSPAWWRWAASPARESPRSHGRWRRISGPFQARR